MKVLRFCRGQLKETHVSIAPCNDQRWKRCAGMYQKSNLACDCDDEPDL